MKKYILLFSCTAVMIIGIVFGTDYLKSTVIAVDTLTINAREVENTLTCSGKVEYLNSTEVLAENPAIIDNVNVNLGDKVDKNTVLLNASEAVVEHSSSLPIDNYKNAIPSNLDLNNTLALEEAYKSYLESQKSNQSSLMNQSFIKTGKKISILSPAKGIVTSINIKNQDSCDKGKPLIVISDTDKYKIHLSVNEAKIPDIKVGQKVYISGVGFKDHQYQGEVSSISNEAQQIVSATGKDTVLDVFVNVEAPESEIKPGLTAKCRIITSEDSQVNVAPYEAVKADKSGKEFVYKYSAGKAVKTYITTGKEYNDGFEVLDGISSGDVIILNPEGLSNFCRVKLNDKSEEAL